VIGVPPSVGAVHVTVALALPATAVGFAGLTGTLSGVTGVDGSEAVLVPTLFLAFTVNVYGVPFFNPVTVHVKGNVPVVLVAVQVLPVGFDVTLYEMIGAPPSVGAVQLTLAAPFPATADGAAGATGTVAGVTETDAVDVVLVPTAFPALTVNVYDVPFVSVVTVHVNGTVPVVVAVEQVLCVDVVDVTVYPVIALPPVVGAVHETVTFVLPDSTLGAFGCVGAVICGKTVTEGVDVGPVPFVLWALTLNE
jgi:hypothetical protein